MSGKESSGEEQKLLEKEPEGRGPAKNLYDEKGLLVSNGKDLCDCLEEECPGCYFPCPKCNSPKCGPECRVNRNYFAESTEIEDANGITVIPARNQYR